MRYATASSMPTCIQEICSWIAKAGSRRSTSASWAGSRRKSGAFLPRSSTVSLRATIIAPQRCISKLATCHRIIRWRALRRRSARSAPPTLGGEMCARATRGSGEPIHNKQASEISMAKLLTLLFEVTGLFDMKTRPELLMLQKTMVVVEGVARSFDPNLDMWATAEPVVREWIERHLGPAGRLEDAAQGAGEVGKFLGDVPGLLGRAARITDQLDAATRDGLVLAPETVAAIGEAEARRSRWTTVALWAIAALLAVVIWKVV